MDGNSLLNIQDIILLINIVLDVSSPNECQIEFGDLNYNITFTKDDTKKIMALNR